MAKQTEEVKGDELIQIASNWSGTLLHADGTTTHVGDPGVVLNFKDAVDLTRVLNEKPYAEEVGDKLIARFKEVYMQEKVAANRLIEKTK